MANSTDLIQLLESNETRVVEEVKQKIYEQFYSMNDSWLLYGLYDYYLQTNSVRCMEILVNIREPHQNFLFNRLSDSIKGSKHDSKVRALTLLGYVLRKDPPWLYKITEHQLIKDLLKFLKAENDIFLLLCALLVLVVLLPIVPSRMGQFLQDVFEIFSRLAAWNCSNPEKLVEDQMIHMQMALYALFQRLYGMYPCNFLGYLRNQYRTKDQLPIFVHTVKPMLDTVKMHPLLVTASKDKETTTERWKKMGPHDVVVECERFSLDVGDRCQHEACYLTSSFRSRSGTSTSTTNQITSNNDSTQHLQFLKSTSAASLAYEAKDFFSPSMTFIAPTQEPEISTQDISSTSAFPHLQVDQNSVTGLGLTSQEGTSPPEAAIEATPETTPVKDLRHTTRSHLPSAASAVRAFTTNLTSRNWSGGSSNSTPNHSQPSSPMRKETSPFSFSENRTSAFAHSKKDTYPTKKLQQLFQERNQVAEAEAANKNFKIPTSPLRIIQSNDIGINLHNALQRIESPISREDEEVLEIVKQGEIEDNQGFRQCDSVLQEGGRGTEDDLDDCEQEHGSPCAAGGLHMPNSRSVNDFAKRMKRFRHTSTSQCTTETEVPYTSTGSSPGNCEIFLSDTVRRANSCPEIKKSSVVPTKDNRNKILLEADEENNKDNVPVENKHVHIGQVSTVETQTDNFWPMPYEHLFLGLFPSLENNDVKPSPAPSPAPTNVQQDKFLTVSPYEIIDKYIDLAVSGSDKDTVKSLKQQLQLHHQQLLFERHRRQTHAVKNRRLLAEAKSSKALEELNSALRDQVQLQQKDIDLLKEQLQKLKKDTSKSKSEHENVQMCENKYVILKKDYTFLKHQNEGLHQELQKVKAQYAEVDEKWQLCESALIDARAEVQVAQEEAWAGERGKVELEQVNKELLLAGEMQLRYREKLTELPLLKRSEQELALLTESYNNEIKNLHQQLEVKTTYLEACRARVTELEDIVNQNDDSSTMQKRILSEIKYEYDEKLKSIMSKYKNQLAVSRSKDEMMLELRSRIETATHQRLHSPDISSCHEVQAVVTDKSAVAAGIAGDSKESVSSTSKI